MFIEKLEILSKKNGEKLSNVLKKLSISPSSATGWKNGATINSDMLIKLANYFNVSTDYILENNEEYKNVSNSNILNSGGNNTININSNCEKSYIDLAIEEKLKEMSENDKIDLLKYISNKE